MIEAQAASGRDGDRRRFGLLDGMTLIGAVAVGIVGAQDLRVDDFGGDRVGGCLALAELAMMLGSCSILLARLRRPRPPLIGIASQPGSIACLLPVGSMLAKDVAWLAKSRPGDVGPIGEQVWLGLELPDDRWALLVGFGWMALILTRRWRPEPSWVDRSGRALGWGWIAWGVGESCLRYCRE